MSDPFFVGIPILIPTETPGKLMVKRKFAFYDSHSLLWRAEEGAIVDGASIPGILKPVLGGSFETPYLGAAVLHDIYCQSRARSKADTDRMFYEAMVTNGVSKWKAALFWAGVRIGGQRW